VNGLVQEMGGLDWEGVHLQCLRGVGTQKEERPRREASAHVVSVHHPFTKAQPNLSKQPL
jgi:hypothetical protein